MIARKYGIIFIHIPKAAGTSVEELLGVRPFDWKSVDSVKLVGLDSKNNLPIQQATPQELIDLKYLTLKDFKTNQVLTIVRNTYDRLVSAYFFMRKVACLNDSFENYLLKEGRFKNAIQLNGRHVHLRGQEEYLFFRNGQNAVDTVLKFEELPDNLLRYLHGVTGRHFQNVPHEKKSLSKKHYSYYFNKRTRDIVERNYAHEISLLGYSFENRKRWYHLF